MNKNGVVQKFNALGQTKKLLIVGGVVVAGVLTVGTYFGDKPVKKSTTINLANDVRPQDNVPEAVAAQQYEAANKIRALEETVRRLTEKQNLPSPPTSGMSVGEAQKLQDQINSLKTQLGNRDLNSPATVIPTIPDKVETTPDVANKMPPPSAAIRVIKSERKAGPEVVADKPTAAYLPSGSNFEAILLNGVDANTSTSANKTPSPSLLRIKTDAILPNLFAQDVKECFVLVGSFGNLSSERAEMRTENISCISESGKTFEGKMEGYVVGEDGKVGMRGRLVSKQGSLLAKSFLAGVAGGISSAFTAQQVQSLNVNPGTTQTYQYPDASVALGNGVAGGLNKSSQMLSQFYIKMAEQMFPVIEIDAGRKVTVILMKGLEIK